MKHIFLVGLGGFLGSVSRYKLGGWILHHYSNSDFPIGTFIINLLGCLTIGFITGLAEKHSMFNQNMLLFTITGFLGGFTTFSAFGYETMFLIRRGQLSVAILNVFLSLVLCLLGVWIGVKLSGLTN